MDSPWMRSAAILSLSLGAVCCLIILFDILRGNRQHMWIMNIVWPVTGLYAGPLALWAYFGMGQLSTENAVRAAQERGRKMPGKKKPFWQIAALGTTHCGSGCTLGDIVSEWFLFFVPLALFGRPLFAAWVLDYLVAFAFGIAFQYFTIRPMKNLPPGKSFIAALKADALSLTSWQIGMYGWMAIVTFVLAGSELDKTKPVFWFMMQIAMLAGFLTSYPVNWWLIRKGIKEPM